MIKISNVEDRTPYVDVHEAIGGPFAVLICWYEEDQMWDVENSWLHQATEASARKDAIMWACDEELRLGFELTPEEQKFMNQYKARMPEPETECTHCTWQEEEDGKHCETCHN